MTSATSTGEAKEKLEKWYKQFEKADAAERKLLDSGKITQNQYIDWRKDEIAKKKHLQAIVNQLTDDFVKSDKIAMEIVSGSAPDVFALNANYTAYDIGQKARAEMPWTMYDRETVNRLIRENPDLLPMPSVNIPLDTRWNQSHVTNAITQGILQGEAIPNIAKRLERVANMDYNTAVRSARTATTAAECAGRTHVYQKAEAMGIEIEQEWLATLDGKTRHEHRQLDGQRVPVGQPFQIDGYEIEYPGDPKAPGYLIYNCRCTTVAAVKGVADTVNHRDSMMDMTYQEWEKQKVAKSLEKSTKNGIIKGKGTTPIGFQFFANRSIPKYSDRQLEKSIKNWNMRIAEHKDKIAHPAMFEKDWDLFDERHRDGEIKHWQHEIQVFEDNIRQAEEELRKRKG